MKNSNRLLAVFLCAAMLLTFFGCGAAEETADIPDVGQEGTPEIFINDELGTESTPPNLVIETTDGETVTATYATLGGYVWEWFEAGAVNLAEEEAPSAADMKNIAVIDRSRTEGYATLQINGGTLRSVQIWQDGEPLESGEKITIENNRIVFPESGAYRYEVVVEYAGGRVYYAFMVTE